MPEEISDNLPAVRGLPAKSSAHYADSYPRPDFVLFGIQDKLGGVILFASKTLTQAELESKFDGYLSSCDGQHGYPVTVDDHCSVMHIPVRRTHFACEFTEFTMIRADSYGDALRDLMSTWKPPEQPRYPAIGSGHE